MLWFLPFSTQGQVKKDKKSELYYAKGIQLFKEQNYSQAHRQFASVKERPFNRVYTASLYMAGLALYYNEEYDRALSQFQSLLNSYPQTIYADDATFHKSLIMLKRPENRLGGLFLLSKLSEDGLNDQIKKDAINAYKDFLYNHSDLKFIKEYYEFIGEKHPNRAIVLEALTYKLYKENKPEELEQYLRSFQDKGGGLTPNLKVWLADPVKEKNKNPKLRVAAILPFQADKSATQLNTVASWSVQLLEGMQLAVLMNSEPIPVDVVVKAFDSRNDVKVTEKLLQGEVKEFKPDIIIGDVMNATSKLIIKFAEENKTIQLIPISPVDELVKDKKYAYLVNASMKTQITGLGNYAIEKLGLNKILILGDNTPLSEVQITFFTDVLQKAGIKPDVNKFPPDINSNKWFFKSIAKQLQEKSYQAVFIASNNESLVKQLLTDFKNNNLKVRVLGSTDWGKFKDIDRKTLSLFNSTFTDGYFTQNDTSKYQAFKIQYKETFRQQPSRYACLGYDILTYVIHLKLSNPNLPYLDAMEKSKPFRGIIQNYYYSKAKDNQSLQILEYRNGKIEKIKLW